MLVTLRKAEASDVQTVLGLIRALAEYERLLSECVADEALLMRHLFSEDPSAEVVLAECDGEAVGFALFFRTFSTFVARPGLYLEDLYVKPSMRGRGVGKRLLEHLMRVALERGCGRLEWSVLKWNTEAIGFYEKMGARPMEGWTVYRMDEKALQKQG
jgi:GNAT superfamily N-acetyltransferase